jgi:hypothetical protein
MNLDAYQLANKIYDDNFNDNITIQLNENENLKTYFEMLLLITTEGFKLFFSDENSHVDIESLSLKDFDKINNYLKKINIKMNLKIFSVKEWYLLRANEKYKSFNTITITNDMNLSDLYFLIVKNNIYVISFSHLIT